MSSGAETKACIEIYTNSSDDWAFSITDSQPVVQRVFKSSNFTKTPFYAEITWTDPHY